MEQSVRAGQFLEEAMERYSETVYRLAFSQLRSKSDADDVYQEVFLRYFRKHPAFESEEHRKAWLLRVTLNCCKKQCSSLWRKRTVALEGHGETEYGFLSEDSGLREALLKLPPNYRAVIHLFYYEDMSVETVAHTLGRKPATVRTQLTRARRLLKAYIDEIS